MSQSPVHDFQMMPPAGVDQPICEESMFFEMDETWKSGFNENNNNPYCSEDSNNSSLSDCVPDSSSSNSTLSSNLSFPHAPVSGYSQNPITGSNAILGNHQVDIYCWKSRDPATWNLLDVALWLQCTADSLRIDSLRAEAFADVDGPTLCKMQMEEFQEREPSYGSPLYMAFHSLLGEYQQQYRPSSFAHNNRPAEYQAPEALTSVDFERYICNISFDGNDTFRSLPSFDSLLPKPNNVQGPDKPTVPKVEITEDYVDSPPPSPTDSEASSTTSTRKTGRRGRSKGKLWEFVLNLLLDKETNPNIIKWEDRSNGVFRIVRSDQVAQLWGKRKSNPTMTYEKMSRAMRYYYRKNILERIDGRRLVYKFGPTSRGWQM